MLNHPRLTGSLAAVAALLVLAACSSSGPGAPPGRTAPAAAYPVTVQAANGGVTVSRRPDAIVSLSPTATEELFAIGAGRQVKAVDKDSDYPPDAPHTNLDAYQLNIEAVAAYRPDLVVASNITSAQAKELRTLNIPVLDEPAAANLTQAYQEIAQLGEATGHAQQAAALLSRMKSEIAAIVKATPRPPGGQATYYYELDQTYYSLTSSTFVGQLLHLLGLRSIADAKGPAASGGYPQLSAEYILKADPDYVFLADTRCCKQSPATVAKRPGWSALGAVRHGRVVALDDDIASRWGPRIVDLLRTVSAAMRRHPST